MKKINVIFSLMMFIVSFSTIASMNDNIRDITIEHLEIDTTTKGAELYNNGRMQKPIVIKYSAYLTKDDPLEPNVYVELTKDEVKYYLKIAEYGEVFPQEIEGLYKNISITRKKNKYAQDLNTGSSPIELDRSERSTKYPEYHTTTFYLSYKGDDKDDTFDHLLLCAYPNPVKPNGDDNYSYPGNDCKNSPNNKREINIISGAYTKVEKNTHDRNAINLVEENLQLCTYRDQCLHYRVRDTSSNDINSADIYQYKFTSPRENHTLIPIDANPVAGRLASGCTIDTLKSNEPLDGICSNRSRWDFYFSMFAYGNNEIDFEGYATGRHGAFKGIQRYKFYPNQSKFGTFTISGVVMDIEPYGGTDWSFVRETPGGDWAGSTSGEKVTIKETMEDNYGNRFMLEANLIPHPDFGKPVGQSGQNVFVILDQTTLKITPIYN